MCAAYPRWCGLVCTKQGRGRGLSRHCLCATTLPQSRVRRSMTVRGAARRWRDRVCIRLERGQVIKAVKLNCRLLRCQYMQRCSSVSPAARYNTSENYSYPKVLAVAETPISFQQYVLPCINARTCAIDHAHFINVSLDLAQR